MPLRLNRRQHSKPTHESETSGTRPALVLVLGSQRSGTNVLRQSLSLDPYVRGFNEHQSNALYEDWKLRPEPQIRQFLREQPATVLLKPIKSVIDRPVADLLADLSDYRLKVAWIYRDPVAVFSSRRRRWPHLDAVEPFVREWNRVNRSVVKALDDRIAIVCYDDLVADRGTFRRLCRFLGVQGEYLFGRDQSRAYDELDAEQVAAIRAGTAETFDLLAQHRRPRPVAPATGSHR